MKLDAGALINVASLLVFHCSEGQCIKCAGGMMVEHPLVKPHVLQIEGTEDGVRGLAKDLVIKLMVECFDSM